MRGDSGTGLPLQFHLRTLSRAIGALAALTAAGDLAEIRFMNPETALAILTGGTGLLLYGLPGAAGLFSRLFRGIMIPLSLLPAFLLLAGQHHPSWPFPASVAPRPDSAIALLLLAPALFLIDRESFQPSDWLAIGAATAAFPGIVGYIYGIRSFFDGSSYKTTLPPVSGFLLFAMAIGVLWARADRGIMAVAAGEGSGGMMARRLLPAALLVPPLVGGLRLYGERMGYYDLDTGLALFATSSVLIFAGLVLWNAHSLDALDAERRRFGEALSRSNLELEDLVARRTGELRDANRALEEKVRDHRQSEEKYRDLIEAAPDPIVITDGEGRIVLVNHQALERFGYAPEEMVGREVEFLMPERFRDRHVQSRILYGKNPGYRPMDPGRSFYGLRKDGSEFPAEISLNPSRSGEDLLVVAIVRDIGERVRTEEALRSYRDSLEEKVRERTEELGEALEARRASEERYRLLSEASLTGVYLIQDALFRYVNPAFAKTFGYAPEEIVDRLGPAELTAPEDRELVEENIRRRLVGGEAELHYVFRGLMKNGEAVDVEVAGVRILYRDRPAITGSLLDLSEQTRARALLARQAIELEQANRELVRNLADRAGINRIATAVMESPDLPSLLAAVSKEILSLSGGECVFIHSPVRDRGEAPFPPCGYSREGPVDPALSREVWLRVEGTLAPTLLLPEEGAGDTLRKAGIAVLAVLPLPGSPDPSGTLSVGSSDPEIFGGDRLGFLENLSRQLSIGLERARLHARTKDWAEELERQVARRTAELETTNRELESFSYSVSHDLRAPLRAIDGFSQALLEEYSGQLDTTGQDYLSRVRAAAQRMGRLIDDILTLSRVARNEVSREALDLGALAREILVEITGRGGRKVEWSVASGLVVRADPRLLRIALANLLDNALKFAKDADPPRIEIGRSPEEGEPVYFVRDNGVGFDMSRAGKLFGVFQRLHDAREFPGTGIGLATVQRVIRKHGGEIRAESAPGRGATFFFTLGEESE